MARIVVQADDQRTVLLDEKEVRPTQLYDEDSAAHLLQRLGWAIRDARSKGMARIMVQTDDRRTVLLDEKGVRPTHLYDEHYAAQLFERLEWAIRDAERRRVSASRRRKKRAGILAWQSAVGRAFD